MRSLLFPVVLTLAASVTAPSAATAAATSAGAAGGAAGLAIEDTMAQRMQACTPCHGAQGRATRDGYFPRIAGKPAGYLHQQLLNFRDGRRTQPAMNRLLEHLSDDYLREMADHFAGLELPYPAPVTPTAAASELQRGESLVRHGDATRRLPACSACHGAAMTGRAPATPGLLGLPRDYLAAQVGAWQNGTRRATAPDCMADVARRLTPDDVFAITSWLAAQPVPPGAAAEPADGGATAPLECGKAAAATDASAAPSAPAPSAPAASSPAAGDRPATLVERGAYLARAGSCLACHTTRGGAPYAGGRGIPTPFGTIYSSNLTPDPDTGLGRWSADDFHRALHDGRSRDGRLLYPAFPYPNYSLLTREDSDALYAFFRTLAPVSRARRDHNLHFPFDSQAALAAWRLMFFEPATFAPRPDRSAQWNRGDYLIRGLGHCDACHAPRNVLGAVTSGELSGGAMPGENWYAPSLGADDEAGVADWPEEDIVALLKTGISRRGSATGPMAEVVANSTRFLTDADLQAMATVLRDRGKGGAGSAPSSAPAAAERRADTSRGAMQARERGQALYRDHCRDCHGDDGRGAPGVYPPLAGNRAVTLPMPTNLVRVVADGGFPPATDGNPRPFGMPPFSHVLDDRAIADVLSYIRQSWGNIASTLSASDVARAKR